MTTTTRTAHTIEVGGHHVFAPGFTPTSFDRAVQRAHDEGLMIEKTDTNRFVLISNPSHDTTYTTSRRTCTCKAGQRGTPCKHIAFAIFMVDIMNWAAPERKTADLTA